MNVLCPHCGVTNKVAQDKIRHLRIKCGKCKQDLEPDASGYPVDVDPSNFDVLVKQASKPVLLDFWSSTCPPCRQLAPVLQQLAKDTVGKVQVAKLKIDDQPAAATLFQIKGVPTLILLSKNKEIARTVGFQSLEQLKRFLAPALEL